MDVSEKNTRPIASSERLVPLIVVVYIYITTSMCIEGRALLALLALSLGSSNYIHIHQGRTVRRVLSPKVSEMGATLELMLALSLDPSLLGARTIRLSLSKIQ
jgi:hypothetical protein